MESSHAAILRLLQTRPICTCDPVPAPVEGIYARQDSWKVEAKMQAEETLKNSPSGAIVADTSRGLVMIRHRRAPETPPPDCFKLLFVSHDEEGWHNGSGIITIGLYDDLEIAVTIAAVRYGISDENWKPADRFAMGILGEMLLQNSPIDATLLVKRSAEPSE